MKYLLRSEGFSVFSVSCFIFNSDFFSFYQLYNNSGLRLAHLIERASEANSGDNEQNVRLDVCDRDWIDFNTIFRRFWA